MFPSNFTVLSTFCQLLATFLLFPSISNMDNRLFCSYFAPSRLSRPNSKPKSTVSHPHITFTRDTQQLKTLIQSLKRLSPHLELKPRPRSRPKSQSRPILVLGYDGGNTGKDAKIEYRRWTPLRTRTIRKHTRAQSASLFPQHPVNPVSTSLAGKAAALSLRTNPSPCLRTKLVLSKPVKARVPREVPAVYSPRGRFHRAVAEAAASFRSEEVVGWD